MSLHGYMIFVAIISPGLPGQSAREAWGEWQARKQYRLKGMIEVRFTAPDLGIGPIVLIQFVMPAAQRRVDEVHIDEVPEAPIPGFVLRLTRAPEQGRGRCAGFGMGPVQALADHRAVVPVQRVDDARRAISVPAVTTGAVEQTAGVVQQPIGGEQAGLAA